MSKEVEQIINAIENDVMSLAYNLAYVYDITLAEIWSEDEIVGMMVDDITIYY